MKIVTVLMSIIPVFLSMYILWHVYKRVPSSRRDFAKARGYLSIFGIFAVTSIYWLFAVFTPEEFGLGTFEEFSVSWFLCSGIYWASVAVTTASFRSYKAYRPNSKTEGRTMAGW